MTRADASPDLFRALGALSERPEPEHVRIARALGLPGGPDAAEHTQVFVFDLPPYASIYVGPEGMLGGDPAERVAGFWRALRLVPPAEPDHLAALLGLYASLLEVERNEGDAARRLLRREARRALLWEHLLSWLDPYTAAVAASEGPFSRAWAALLRAALIAQAADLGPAETLPAHLRSVPDLPAPGEEGIESFVGAILTPVRSGMILTRADLALLGRRRGVPTRLGERAFILRAMLAQDAGATLVGLADVAAAWARRHREDEPALGVVAHHWRTRAEAARIALLEASEAAGEVAHAGADGRR